MNIFFSFATWDSGPTSDNLDDYFKSRLIPFRFSEDGKPYAKLGQDWLRVNCEQKSEHDIAAHRYSIYLTDNA